MLNSLTTKRKNPKHCSSHNTEQIEVTDKLKSKENRKGPHAKRRATNVQLTTTTTIKLI